MLRKTKIFEMPVVGFQWLEVLSDAFLDCVLLQLTESYPTAYTAQAARTGSAWYCTQNPTENFQIYKVLSNNKTHILLPAFIFNVQKDSSSQWTLPSADSLIYKGSLAHLYDLCIYILKRLFLKLEIVWTITVF